MQRTFNILGKISNNVTFDELVMTAHWSTDRVERHEKICKEIGKGKLIASFEVDTDHRDGNEIHNVFSNGIILIQNKESKRLVTELIARPGQISRYWNGLGLEIPQNVYNIINKARDHQVRGWNYW